MAIKFKGVDLDGDLERVIPHVAATEEYGGALQHLQSVWDNLTLLGELSGNNTDMSGTRVAFRELAETLLNQLGREALKKCLQDLSAKAQVTINILVRNLFERTADIGFLSCDDDVRAFLRDTANQRERLPALRRRFGEYVRKYSVYSDIIVLDPAGNVLARLDETVDVAAGTDPAIHAAVETRAAYVESFGVSDLVPGQKRSLIYSYRVADHNGVVLGVLCLCFRLENEADLIFSNLVEEEDWSIVTILDETGSVIASSDPFHSCRRQAQTGARCRLSDRPLRADGIYRGDAGRPALSRLCRSGLAAMVPLPHAFAASSAEMLAGVEPAMIDASSTRRTVQRRYACDPSQGRPHPARAEPLGVERNLGRRTAQHQRRAALPPFRKRCSSKSAILAPRLRTSFKARLPT